MEIVTKRDGKYIWIALRDAQGIYHCLVDDSHQSESIYFAGHLYLKEQAFKVKEMLKKEEHKS